MSNEKLVKSITSMEDDFAQWYTDVVRKAELVDYSSVRGCLVIRPYGYAIWEHIQRLLNDRFVETGHENVYMPLFIPESLLQKEKDHVEGFAPEVAWVTHGGNEKLEERLCVRPTSETLFCEHYANTVQSYRDLPKLYNQWCSVVRWEKTTRPFLRSREFLWQEGHTIHATPEQAQEETTRMLGVYADFVTNQLAIPVIQGQKTEKERFAGAVSTYTIEAMMHDGKALQCGTSHYFGDGFARAFGIQFADESNRLVYPHQTSWGVSTRLIGAIIMAHGDDNGLVLPSAVAPKQVLERANALYERLRKVCRAAIDVCDQSPGWKFAEYEMKGVPLRIEIGPRDIEQNQCVAVRRDNREKTVLSLDEVETRIPQLLDAVRDGLYENALARRSAMTYTARSLPELIEIADNRPGLIKAMWCGDRACEDALKERAGVSSRCIPFAQEPVSDVCVCCGRPAKHMLYWGKAY